MPFSRGSSWPRDWTWSSCNAGGYFTTWAPSEVQVHITIPKTDKKGFPYSTELHSMSRNNLKWGKNWNTDTWTESFSYTQKTNKTPQIVDTSVKSRLKTTRVHGKQRDPRAARASRTTQEWQRPSLRSLEPGSRNKGPALNTHSSSARNQTSSVATMSNRLGAIVASPASLWAQWDPPPVRPRVVAFP